MAETALQAPVFDPIREAPDDLQVAVTSSVRVIRRYLEQLDATYTDEQMREDAERGIVPKPIQLAARMVELRARDQVADKASVQKVFHTFLPRTALANAPQMNDPLTIIVPADATPDQ